MIQPWASLFVLGEAQYETRTWKTNHRGPLAIHSSKKVDRASCQHPTIQALLEKHGFKDGSLPTGSIIGTCNLIKCIKVVERNDTSAVLENGRLIEGIELLLGDYRVGCYAWEVENRKMLKEYIPAKGQLGLWEYHRKLQ